MSWEKYLRKPSRLRGGNLTARNCRGRLRHGYPIQQNAIRASLGQGNRSVSCNNRRRRICGRGRRRGVVFVPLRFTVESLSGFDDVSGGFIAGAD